MTDAYFVLQGTEDGVRVREMSKSELESYLNDTEDIQEQYRPVALSKLPRDLMYAKQNEIVIIKGEIVVPKAVERVTKFDVP